MPLFSTSKPMPHFANSWISVRTNYNLAALSFTAQELQEEIRKHLPEFSCIYEPDFRRAIADSRPNTVDDAPAREDWG